MTFLAYEVVTEGSFLIHAEQYASMGNRTAFNEALRLDLSTPGVLEWTIGTVEGEGIEDALNAIRAGDWKEYFVVA